MKYSLLIFLLFCLVNVSVGQSYDADSIYYSPIPKVTDKKNHGKGVSVNDFQNETSKSRLTYFFSVQTGALIGCKNCNFKREITLSSATIHGLSIGDKLRVGAGIGFDSYSNWQSIPVFGSISWDLFGNKNRNAFFLQFNYGWSKMTANRSTLSYYQDIKGGRMVSTLAGYRIRYHDLKIAIGIGSKYQRVSASYEYPSYWYDFRGSSIIGTPNTTTLRESINRLALVISIGWK